MSRNCKADGRIRPVPSLDTDLISNLRTRCPPPREAIQTSPTQVFFNSLGDLFCAVKWSDESYAGIGEYKSLSQGLHAFRTELSIGKTKAHGMALISQIQKAIDTSSQRI